MPTFFHIRRVDWTLFGSVFVLLAFGTMAIASIAFASDIPDWRNTIKHLVFIGAGCITVFGGMQIDYRAFRAGSRFAYIGGIFLLLGVLFFGTTIRGTRGWFSWGSITWQPAEVTKIFLLIFLAKYFEQWARDIDRIRHILLSGIGVFVYVLLIFLQPDTGSAFLFFLVWFGMLLIVGIRRRHLALLLLFFTLLGLFGWTFALRDYQRARITTFFHADVDPLGRSYNITQARIAIGGGQIFGRGFGFGSQSQLRFLPEAETDFIFAVIAEELGFIGAALLVCAWLIFFWRIILALRRAQDDFGFFFLTGALLLFFIEVSVTIGMNVGMLPVTGLTLPFVSYGGSSLLTHFAILAITQSIIIRNRFFSE